MNTVIGIIAAVLYGAIFVVCCVCAFYEEDSRESENIVLAGMFWPALLVGAAFIGPFALAGHFFDKWRQSVLTRRREARWALERSAPALPPPAPELPQVGYRDGVCAHCGHAIERKERAA